MTGRSWFPAPGTRIACADLPQGHGDWVWPGGLASSEDRAGSVAGALLDLRPFGLVRPALLVQRVAGLVHVPREALDLLAAHGLLDQGAEDLHVLRVRGEGVRRHHPPALGRELPGDVGLVVVVLAGELALDDGQ